MRVGVVGIACSLFMALPSTAWSTCEPNATPAQIQAELEYVLQDPNAEPVEDPSVRRFVVPQDDGSTLHYYFTIAGHPAHPAVVEEDVFSRDGRIYIRVGGMTAGDCTLFEQWLAAFRAQNERIGRQLGGDGS